MLDEVRQTWKEYVEARLAELAAGKLGEGVALPALVLQTPPKPEMGDIAFPLFAYAKALHMGPAQIAAQLKGAIEADPSAPSGTLLLAGPYLNIKLDMASLANTLYQKVVGEGAPYGHTDMLKGKKVMIEFSCPNTNKPLHLGHMRNDSLGSSVSEILKANGAEVMKVNLINNRGVHICKSGAGPRLSRPARRETISSETTMCASPPGRKRLSHNIRRMVELFPSRTGRRLRRVRPDRPSTCWSCGSRATAR